MAVYCIVFEIKRDIDRKTPIFILLVFNLHDPLELLRLYTQNFNTNCLIPLAIKQCKNITEKFKSLPRVQQRYRRLTDDRRAAAHAQHICYKSNIT